MSRYLNSVLGLPAILLLASCPVVVFGQSTVVGLPGEAGVGALSLQNDQSVIPNSITPQIRRTESRLLQPTPQAWRPKMPMRNLLRLMDAAGYSVLLGDSAIEFGLESGTPVRLALRNATIDTNLRFALRAYQCDYIITDDGIILILSSDAGLDIENMSTVTFDISSLANGFEDADEIMATIQGTIDPDYWEESGGVGRLALTQARQGFLLTITASWQHIRQVRDLLENQHALGGGAPLASGSTVAGIGASRPVQLPDAYMALRRNRRGMSLPGSGTTSAFGGGGAMRGGGVF